MANHVLRDRIWESNKLALCSRDAALAYPWIFLVADDHGRFEYRPRVIWGRAFAAREDVSVEDVAKWLSEYEKTGLLVRYKGGDLAYWTGFTGRAPSQRRQSLYPDPSTLKERRRRLPDAYDKNRRRLGEPYDQPRVKPRQDLPSAEIERSGAEQSRSGAEHPAPPSADTGQAGAQGVAIDRPRRAWNQEACEDWTEGTAGAPNGARVTKGLKPLLLLVAKKHGIEIEDAWDRVRPYWQRFCRSPAAKYGPESFANNPRQVIEGGERQSAVGAMLDALEDA